jgi:uncharacterized protein (TIGR02646 family)
MIKVNKQGYAVPVILTTDGVNLHNQYIASYTVSSAGYALNTLARTKFSFDGNVYGHETVKTLLKTIQHDKCCFCEAKVSHISDGDIEHFRPKAGYKQDEHSTIVYPGYFWLVYEWTNLYLSCLKCNARNKLNYFPLANNRNRANPLTRSISRETPHFIDPGGRINPETQIYFIREVPSHRSLIGKKTICYLGLDRLELNEHRLTPLQRMESMERIYLLTRDSMKSAAAELEFFGALRKAIDPRSEYSSMFKNNFSKYLSKI